MLECNPASAARGTLLLCELAFKLASCSTVGSQCSSRHLCHLQPSCRSIKGAWVVDLLFGVRTSGTKRAVVAGVVEGGGAEQKRKVAGLNPNLAKQAVQDGERLQFKSAADSGIHLSLSHVVAML